MTDQPTDPSGNALVVLPVTMADIMAQIASENAQRAALRPANKIAVFAALAGAGIANVTVSFDGYGDSGQIESIDARDPSGADVPLPAETIAIVAIVWGKPAPEPREMTLTEAIEHLVYEVLQETHGGWENNEGAYGEFVFDVANSEIQLDYNERIMATETHSHVF